MLSLVCVLCIFGVEVSPSFFALPPAFFTCLEHLPCAGCCTQETVLESWHSRNSRNFFPCRLVSRSHLVMESRTARLSRGFWILDPGSSLEARAVFPRQSPCLFLGWVGGQNYCCTQLSHHLGSIVF